MLTLVREEEDENSRPAPVYPPVAKPRGRPVPVSSQEYPQVTSNDDKSFSVVHVARPAVSRIPEYKPRVKEPDFLVRIPTPDLNPAELLLTNEEKEIRVVLRKLCLYDKFKKLKPGTLVEYCFDEVPNAPGKHSDLLYLSGTTPDQVFLMWFHNSDKAYLLQRWLTDMAADFPKFSSLEGAIGTMVASLYPADGCWYRAYVLERDDDRNVKVQFVDYGNIDIVGLESLRKLPAPLVHLPTLCFAASLPNTIPEGEPEPFEWDYELSSLFVDKLENATRLEGFLEGFDVERNSWRIQMWDSQEPNEQFNQLIRNRIRERRIALDKLNIKDPVRKEMQSLIHLDREVDVLSSREVSFKGLRNYRIVHIVSPSDFSVEFVTDKGVSEDNLKWRETMQDFYKDEKLTYTYRLKTSNVFVGRCYAWKNSETSRWERIRVIETKIEVRLCRIHAMDVGYFKIVGMDNIYELSPEFVKCHALTCGAYLVDIAPPDDREVWPQRSIDGFKKLVEGRIYHGLEMSSETVQLGAKTSLIKLGLILMDKDKSAQLTLNAHLNALGLAESTGIACGRRDVSHDVAGAPYFDVDEFKAYLEDNGMKTDVIKLPRRPPAILTGLPTDSKSGQEVWAQFPKALSNWYKNGTGLRDEIEHLPTIFRRRMGVCNIRRVVSPGCFYIQMIDVLPEMVDMMENIRIQVENTPALAKEDLYDGAIVAVKVWEGQKVYTWNRAIVKQYLSKISMIKIILIDLGEEARTQIDCIRFLPPYFSNIPGFCQRVHLEVKDLTPSNGRIWTVGAKETFRRYLNSWEKEIPVYYYWRTNDSEKIELDEIDHDVQYNEELNKWEKGHQHNIPHEKHLLKMKDNILLRNIFCSIGVDVAYEVFTGANAQYKFERIWDILRTRGFTVIRKKPNNVELTDGDDEDAAWKEANRWVNHPEN